MTQQRIDITALVEGIDFRIRDLQTQFEILKQILRGPPQQAPAPAPAPQPERSSGQHGPGYVDEMSKFHEIPGWHPRSPQKPYSPSEPAISASPPRMPKPQLPIDPVRPRTPPLLRNLRAPGGGQGGAFSS